MPDFLARLPKLTDGTYRSTFIDALASEERGAGLYRARGEREGRVIDIDQLLLFTIRDGVVTEVLALPSDPAAFDADPAAGIQSSERLGNAVGQTATGVFGYRIGADQHSAAYYSGGGSDFIDSNPSLAGVQISLTGTIDNNQ